MTPKRWAEVERLFQAALAFDERGRGAYLAEACGGDDELRRAVESLISRAADTRGFLDAPAIAWMPPLDTVRSTSSRPPDIDDARFAPGHIFASRYRIVSLLGRGAMGEVYRADDLRLGRPIALKLLTVPAVRQAELNRFVAEVRLASEISHPNVCR